MNEFNNITITYSTLFMMHKYRRFTLLYSKHVITIFIVNRRHAIIIIVLLIKTWGTKNIIFIKYSTPKLMAWHITSIKDIQGIYTSNIAIMLIIQRFYAMLKIGIIKIASNSRKHNLHSFCIFPN